MTKKQAISYARRHTKRLAIGDRPIISHGLPKHYWSDIYHMCLGVSWPVFFAAIVASFILSNTFFATLYSFGDSPISNLNPPGFLGLFFFSVETIATVGFGDMHPISLYAHIISVVEIIFGMISVAILTGLIFSRFSRPRAKMMFANHPVVGLYDGKLTLSIRVANARQNVILDAVAKLRLMRNEISTEGYNLRRIYDLALVRNEQPMFILGWTLMHVIDECSAFYGETQESLKEAAAMLILTLQGTDESTVQAMQARHLYNYHDIRWDHRYHDMTHTDSEGVTHMDYEKFHHILPAPTSENNAAPAE